MRVRRVLLPSLVSSHLEIPWLKSDKIGEFSIHAVWHIFLPCLEWLKNEKFDDMNLVGKLTLFWQNSSSLYYDITIKRIWIEIQLLISSRPKMILPEYWNLWLTYTDMYKYIPPPLLILCRYWPIKHGNTMMTFNQYVLMRSPSSINKLLEYI